MRRWYAQDWVTIDSKVRPGIIEGLSVFLSVFDLRDVGATFRPRKPPAEAPACPAAVVRQLRPLNEVIDSGEVLGLNMPARTKRPRRAPWTCFSSRGGSRGT